ncbi:hypothetical protein [Phaeovulum sp.]|uniref:hypothetical protein n=1 Tax=Phaeovulum sp. TaxID=2934796 RepID=UPI0039E6EDB2
MGLIRVYYDTETGDIRFTMLLAAGAGQGPAGNYIEVPDDTPTANLAALRVADGALVTANLAPLKLDAVAKINQVIGYLRAAITTDIAGQQMIYLRKESEARAWLAEATPDIAEYPMIAAEVGITGETADQVAQVWVNMAALWTGISAGLEGARIGHISLVDAAQTAAEIDAAVVAFFAVMEAIT